MFKSDVLVSIATLAAVCVTATGSNAAGEPGPEASNQPQNQVSEQGTPSNLYRLKAMADKLHLQVQISENPFTAHNHWGQIEGKAVDGPAMERYLPLFLDEFELYPQTAIEKTGLRRLVFCRSLLFDGQRRAAIPDFGQDTLYLDIDRGSYVSDYQAKTLHHEFFHIIDWKDDGLVYEDLEWKKLNVPGFKYLVGGKWYQNDGKVGLPDDSVVGFLNRYAATGVEEDKAEMYGNMLVHYSSVAKRAETDSVIKAKMEAIKALLSKFCAAFDEKFWLAVKAHEKPQ